MAATIFHYSEIDNLPDELFFNDFDRDKKTGAVKGLKKPVQKKRTVELNGKQFEVSPKIQRHIAKMWDREDIPSHEFDPEGLLDLCEKYNIPPEGHIDDGSGVFCDNPLCDLLQQRRYSPELVIKELDEETITKRVRAFVHVLIRCFDDDVLKEIVARATKKKNGLLYKGRLLTIAHLSLMDYSGSTYMVVAKNTSDAEMTIELRERGINSTWFNDADMFTSTRLFTEK